MTTIGGTCKDCAHWLSLYVDLREGVCAVDDDAGSVPQNERHSAGCDGDVYTGPDFGCIHWKERP